MNALNTLYVLIVKALGGEIDTDYSLFYTSSGNRYDIKVDDKKVYLPVNETLNSQTGDKVFFHPACESIVSKETEIDKVIRKMMTISIYRTFQVIPEILFKIANKHNKLQSNKLKEMLEPLRGLSNEVRQEVVNLIARISILPEVKGVDTRIVHFSINRGGKNTGGEHIYYKCAASFPYYTELNRIINQNSHLKDSEFIIFADNKVSLKAAKAIIAFFEIIIPAVTDTSRLTSEVTTQVASRLVAMLRCFSYIAGEVNELIGKFRKEFDSANIYGYNLEFLDKLEDIGDIYNLVLPLDYNNYNTQVDQPAQQHFNNDLFSFNSNVQQPVVNQQQQQPSQNGSNVTQPPTLPGEVYKGVTILPNGLYEFTFQAGNMIHVIAKNDKNVVVNDGYVNAQPQQPMYPQPQFQQPQFQQQQPIVTGTGYYTLPNGVVVPINSGWNNQQQQQPQQTGWNTTSAPNISTNGLPIGGYS